MPQVPLILPGLPDAEALKVGRPASSAAILPLVQAPAYTLGLRAMRTHVQPFTLQDWADDLVATSAEVRRVLYRPSPLARRLWIGCWIGSDWRGTGSSPPTKVEVQCSIIDDATLSSLVVIPALSPGRPRRPGYAGDWLPALPFIPDDSGLNRGIERLVSTAWDGVDITGLDGLDGWVQVSVEGASVLAVAWVELVEEVQP